MAAKTNFRGSYTALVTPFKNGALDEAAFRALVDWQIAEGTHGLVPVGTTGESPTLSHDEHKRVVEMCVEEAKRPRAGDRRRRLELHQGSRSSWRQHAEKAGADAVLVVTPYYNKPTQEGMYQHFKAINDAIGIPILIYNIPPRSVIDMSVETMARLFELKNIVGVKDATANMVRVSQQRVPMGQDFNQLSGEDAHGARLHGAWRSWLHLGDVERRAAPVRGVPGRLHARRLRRARELQDRLMPLHDALFIESQSGAVKYALSLLGKMRRDVRLPLVKVSEPTRKRDPRRHGPRGTDQLSRRS